MNTSETLESSSATAKRGFVPNFTDPAFFDEISNLRHHETSSYLLTLAAMLDGYDVRFLRTKQEANLTFRTLSPNVTDAEFFEVSAGPTKRFFQGSLCSLISSTATDAARNKMATKKLLHIKGVNTPVGGEVTPQNLKVLQAMANAGVNLFLLKPVEGSLSRGIASNLTAAAAAAHVRRYPEQNFIVEQQIIGREIRTFVAGGKVIAAYVRIPQHVIGDGKRTSRQLLEQRTDDRKINPQFCNKEIDIAQAEIAVFHRGDTLDRIPKIGEKVMLITRLVSSAADDRPDCLDQLPASAVKTCTEAAKALGAPVLSFDCIIDRAGQTYILEANTKTMFSALCFPHPTGRWTLDVPRAILQQFLPKPKLPKRVITGYRFSDLRAEIFREGRRKPVNALDFVDLA
jgi:cyanophycin synthetase